MPATLRVMGKKIIDDIRSDAEIGPLQTGTSFRQAHQAVYRGALQYAYRSHYADTASCGRVARCTVVNEKEICLQFLHELNGVSFSSIQHRKAGVSGASYLTDVQPGRRIGKESAYGGR